MMLLIVPTSSCMGVFVYVKKPQTFTCKIFWEEKGEGYGPW